MSPHAAWLAWALAAMSLLITALGLVLIFLGWSTPLPKEWNPWMYQAIDAVGMIGAPILGGLIASRRPENPYGWLWIGFGMGFALLTFADAYSAYALVVEPGSLPAPRMVGVLANEGFVLWVTLLSFLLLLFPDGRLPSHRWRYLAWSVVAVGAVRPSVGRHLREARIHLHHLDLPQPKREGDHKSGPFDDGASKGIRISCRAHYALV